MMGEERKAEATNLRNARMEAVAAQTTQRTERKKQAKDVFAKRQQERLAAEAAEKERLKKWRLESLEKNKADFHMDMREGDPGYGPTRWCWPTAYHHPRHFATGEDVSIDFVLGPGGIVASPSTHFSSATKAVSPQPGESTLLELSENLGNHLEVCPPLPTSLGMPSPSYLPW